MIGKRLERFSEEIMLVDVRAPMTIQPDPVALEISG
jgi:hypothetical protein